MIFHAILSGITVTIISIYQDVYDDWRKFFESYVHNKLYKESKRKLSLVFILYKKKKNYRVTSIKWRLLSFVDWILTVSLSQWYRDLLRVYHALFYWKNVQMHHASLAALTDHLHYRNCVPCILPHQDATTQKSVVLLSW